MAATVSEQHETDCGYRSRSLTEVSMCNNCKYFFMHYITGGSSFRPLDFGHCAHHVYSAVKHRYIYDVCNLFRQRNDRSNE